MILLTLPYYEACQARLLDTRTCYVSQQERPECLHGNVRSFSIRPLQTAKAL